MTDIGEQFAMMNEISGLLSQRTFDRFVEEAKNEIEKDYDTDKINELQVYEFLTAKDRDWETVLLYLSYFISIN